MAGLSPMPAKQRSDSTQANRSASATASAAAEAAKRAAAAAATDKIGTVDYMMLYVQALQRSSTGVQPTDLAQDQSKVMLPIGEANGGIPQNSEKKSRYQCDFMGCNKSFRQRMHLETHKRSHTGERPFLCPYPDCNKAFSQRSNLRTHLRSHSGERPFSCDVCGRRFTQRGNLKNHQKLHGDTREYACKLDGCNKSFNQLGNLKAHHNSAHAETVAAFTKHLQEAATMPKLSTEEQEMFNYFCELYRNANRGIKGRGKGTRTILQREKNQPALLPLPVSAMHTQPPPLAQPPHHQQPLSVPRSDQPREYAFAGPPIAQPNGQTLPPPHVMASPQAPTAQAPTIVQHSIAPALPAARRTAQQHKMPLPPLRAADANKQQLPTMLPSMYNQPGPPDSVTSFAQHKQNAERVATESLLNAVQNWQYFSASREPNAGAQERPLMPPQTPAVAMASIPQQSPQNARQTGQQADSQWHWNQRQQF